VVRKSCQRRHRNADNAGLLSHWAQGPTTRGTSGSLTKSVPGNSGGVVQEYAGGKLASAYSVQCPSPAGCNYMYSASFDVAVNSKNVFAALEYMDYEVCNPSCSSYNISGFEYWPNGNPSATPTLSSRRKLLQPGLRSRLADVDRSGNLWFTGLRILRRYALRVRTQRGHESNDQPRSTLRLSRPVRIRSGVCLREQRRKDAQRHR